jgi:hypothetical protein
MSMNINLTNRLARTRMLGGVAVMLTAPDADALCSFISDGLVSIYIGS